VPVRLPAQRTPLRVYAVFFPRLASSHSVQKNGGSNKHVTTFASDKRSGLIKWERFERRHPHQLRDFLPWPQNSGAEYATYKNKINFFTQTYFVSSRNVLQFRQNHTLRQSCAGPKQNVKNGIWRKSFSVLCFGTKWKCIARSALTQGNSPGVPIRQEAGWAPQPCSGDTKISTHVSCPVRS
jgi:hypothetical protein